MRRNDSSLSSEVTGMRDSCVAASKVELHENQVHCGLRIGPDRAAFGIWVSEAEANTLIKRLHLDVVADRVAQDLAQAMAASKFPAQMFASATVRNREIGTISRILSSFISPESPSRSSGRL
jgi:hypothetical protein